MWNKTSILSLEESIALSTKKFGHYYSKHINPGLFSIYKLLGFSDMDVASASGTEIYLKDGRTILDFSSAIGILGLGHNHPRIIAAERLCHSRQLIDAIKVAPHRLQAALAYNLAELLPDPLQISFFALSGAEAVEGAMKLCEKAQRSEKTKFITTEGSYHGKTHGALSVTKSGSFDDGFLMGIPEQNVITIKYGKLDALEEAIRAGQTAGSRNSIIAIILEPIQGQSITVPPKGYLEQVVDICRKNNILVIFDEVKAGIGRTGKFCSFQHEDVVPDVVTLSKALGGGKRAISAFVTTEKLFKKAYGKRKDSALHTTTLGGLGESCAVAIETLNILEDHNLIDAADKKGKYLINRLEALKQKHPRVIREIRGRGLLLGIRFNYDVQSIRKFLSNAIPGVIKTVDSILIASIVSELYGKYHIITHFSNSDLDVLQVMPPLIVSYPQIDTFVEAIDGVLETGFPRLVGNFVASNII